MSMSKSTLNSALRAVLGAILLLGTVAIPIVGFASSSLSAPTQEEGVAGRANGCRYERFSPTPGRTVSAAWNPSGDELLLIDSVFDEIVGYDLRGRVRAVLPDFTRQPLEELRPYRVIPGKEALWFSLGGPRMVSVGRDLRFSNFVDLSNEAVRGNGWSVASVMQVAVANGDFITFGDMKDIDPEPSATTRGIWKQAFLRIPIAKPDQYKILWEEFPPFDSNRRNFYKLAQPRIAAVGSTAYVLMMNEQVEVWEHEKGSTALESSGISLPKKFQKRADDIPYLKDDVQLEDIYQAIKGSTMITGLYGWREHLYLVAREPGVDGTKWSLVQIDPKKDTEAVLSTATIGSSAAHLMAIPGDRWWAFIEKGPRKEFNRQEVQGVHYVPSRLVHDLETGPLCQGQ